MEITARYADGGIDQWQHWPLWLIEASNVSKIHAAVKKIVETNRILQHCTNPEFKAQQAN